jgi:hypothetical protein
MIAVTKEEADGKKVIIVAPFETALGASIPEATLPMR